MYYCEVAGFAQRVISHLKLTITLQPFGSLVFTCPIADHTIKFGIEGGEREVADSAAPGRITRFRLYEPVCHQSAV